MKAGARKKLKRTAGLLDPQLYELDRLLRQLGLGVDGGSSALDCFLPRTPQRAPQVRVQGRGARAPERQRPLSPRSRFLRASRRLPHLRPARGRRRPETRDDVQRRNPLHRMRSRARVPVLRRAGMPVLEPAHPRTRRPRRQPEGPHLGARDGVPVEPADVPQSRVRHHPVAPRVPRVRAHARMRVRRQGLRRRRRDRAPNYTQVPLRRGVPLRRVPRRVRRRSRQAGRPRDVPVHRQVRGHRRHLRGCVARSLTVPEVRGGEVGVRRGRKGSEHGGGVGTQGVRSLPGGGEVPGVGRVR